MRSIALSVLAVVAGFIVAGFVDVAVPFV